MIFSVFSIVLASLASVYGSDFQRLEFRTDELHFDQNGTAHIELESGENFEIENLKTFQTEVRSPNPPAYFILNTQNNFQIPSGQSQSEREIFEKKSLKEESNGGTRPSDRLQGRVLSFKNLKDSLFRFEQISKNTAVLFWISKTSPNGGVFTFQIKENKLVATSHISSQISIDTSVATATETYTSIPSENSKISGLQFDQKILFTLYNSKERSIFNFYIEKEAPASEHMTVSSGEEVYRIRRADEVRGENHKVARAWLPAYITADDVPGKDFDVLFKAKGNSFKIQKNAESIPLYFSTNDLALEMNGLSSYKQGDRFYWVQGLQRTERYFDEIQNEQTQKKTSIDVSDYVSRWLLSKNSKQRVWDHLSLTFSDALLNQISGEEGLITRQILNGIEKYSPSIDGNFVYLKTNPQFIERFKTQIEGILSSALVEGLKSNKTIYVVVDMLELEAGSEKDFLTALFNTFYSMVKQEVVIKQNHFQSSVKVVFLNKQSQVEHISNQEKVSGNNRGVHSFDFEKIENFLPQKEKIEFFHQSLRSSGVTWSQQKIENLLEKIRKEAPEKKSTYHPLNDFDEARDAFEFLYKKLGENAESEVFSKSFLRMTHQLGQSFSIETLQRASKIKTFLSSDSPMALENPLIGAEDILAEVQTRMVSFLSGNHGKPFLPMVFMGDPGIGKSKLAIEDLIRVFNNPRIGKDLAALETINVTSSMTQGDFLNQLLEKSKSLKIQDKEVRILVIDEIDKNSHALEPLLSSFGDTDRKEKKLINLDDLIVIFNINVNEGPGSNLKDVFVRSMTTTSPGGREGGTHAPMSYKLAKAFADRMANSLFLFKKIAENPALIKKEILSDIALFEAKHKIRLLISDHDIQVLTKKFADEKIESFRELKDKVYTLLSEATGHYFIENNRPEFEPGVSIKVQVAGSAKKITLEVIEQSRAGLMLQANYDYVKSRALLEKSIQSLIENLDNERMLKKSPSDIQYFETHIKNLNAVFEVLAKLGTKQLFLPEKEKILNEGSNPELPVFLSGAQREAMLQPLKNALQELARESSVGLQAISMVQILLGEEAQDPLHQKKFDAWVEKVLQDSKEQLEIQSHNAKATAAAHILDYLLRKIWIEHYEAKLAELKNIKTKKDGYLSGALKPDSTIKFDTKQCEEALLKHNEFSRQLRDLLKKPKF